VRDDRKIAFNRRRLLKASGLIPLTALAVPALSAWGDGGSSGGQLTAWGVVSFTKEGDRQVEEQMQEWGDANGFTVEYSPVPGSNYPAKLATAVEAGSLPDVVMLEDTQPIDYGGQGHLENLTDLFTELKGQGGGMFDTLSGVRRCLEQPGVPIQAGGIRLQRPLDLRLAAGERPGSAEEHRAGTTACREGRLGASRELLVLGGVREEQERGPGKGSDSIHHGTRAG